VFNAIHSESVLENVGQTALHTYAACNRTTPPMKRLPSGTNHYSDGKYSYRKPGCFDFHAGRGIIAARQSPNPIHLRLWQAGLAVRGTLADTAGIGENRQTDGSFLFAFDHRPQLLVAKLATAASPNPSQIVQGRTKALVITPPALSTLIKSSAVVSSSFIFWSRFCGLRLAMRRRCS
jgi:hypothetical protein